MPVARFSQHAQDYDAHATIQKDNARKLLSLALNHSTEPSKICDLGCGTGYLGTILSKQLDDFSLTCCDSSTEMLAICQKNLSKGNSTFLKNSLPTDNAYDLIISNFAFQWYENLIPTLAQCIEKLSPGGVFAFSMPVKGTFKHLQTILSDLGQDSLLFPYYDENEIINFCEDNAFLRSEVFEVEDIFPNTLSFLKALHLTGATLRDKHLSTGILRKIINTHDELFNGAIKAKYRILTAVFKKDQQ